jgi:hypothetical protein
VWQRLRDALADVDTFLVLYCDEFVSDLHDFWHGMEGVYDLVDEYCAALDGYQSKNAMAGETERILPVWHLAKCQSALASFFVDSSRYAAACEMYMKAIANWDLSPGRQVSFDLNDICTFFLFDYLPSPLFSFVLTRPKSCRRVYQSARPDPKPETQNPNLQADAANTSLQLGETYMGWGKLAEAEDALKQVTDP